MKEKTLTGIDTSSANGPLSDANSPSYDNELDNPEYMASLLEPEDIGAENSDFPPVPEGFPYPSVWIRIPGYQKGEKPKAELIGRVLVKLWNQGIHGFESGAYSHGKVYPLYSERFVIPIVVFFQGLAGLMAVTRGHPLPQRDSYGMWKTTEQGGQKDDGATINLPRNLFLINVFKRPGTLGPGRSSFFTIGEPSA